MKLWRTAGVSYSLKASTVGAMTIRFASKFHWVMVYGKNENLCVSFLVEILSESDVVRVLHSDDMRIADGIATINVLFCRTWWDVYVFLFLVMLACLGNKSCLKGCLYFGTCCRHIWLLVSGPSMFTGSNFTKYKPAFGFS